MSNRSVISDYSPMRSTSKKGSNSRFCFCMGIDIYPKKSKTRKIDAKKKPLRRRACVGKRPLKNQGTFPWGCPHFWGDPSARSARSRPRKNNLCTVQGAKIISTSPPVAYILPFCGNGSNFM